MNERAKYIGSSDIPTIVGASPWSTPYKLWQEKLGLIEPQPETWRLYRGKAMENVIVSYLETQGIIMRDQNKYFYSSENELFRAEVDAIDMEGTHYEFKTASDFRYNEFYIDELGQTVVPLNYYIQRQWAMGICGKQNSILYVDSLGELRGFPIQFDERYFKNQLLPAAETFLYYLKNNIAPPPLTITDVAEKHERQADKIKEADRALYCKVLETSILSKEIKDMEAKLDLSKVGILDYMGDSTVLKYDGNKICTTTVRKPKKDGTPSITLNIKV